jgi:ABC-type Mn2+/Zn2+ transport system ATPase subunit
MTVHSGEYWGIIGPNGAGKTTLFKTILGLIPPLAGKLDNHIPAPGRIAYVPQQTTLKSNLPVSVRDLIFMPMQSLWPFTSPSQELLDRLDFFAHRLGIAHLLSKQISETSGGEKQKSLICRALMMGSPVLLLDEPTNGMDLGSEKEILTLIKKLNREDGYTVLFVTHFLAHLLNEADHFALFSGKKLLTVPREELVSGPLLSELYQRPISVDCVADHYSLRVGGKPE